MRIFLTLSFILAAVFHSFAADTTNNVAASIIHKKVLRLGVKEAPPFIYENEYGNPEGLSISLAQAMAEKHGWEIEYVPYTLEEMLDKVVIGNIDFSINPITVTAERMKKVDFTQPFFISQLAIATKPQEGNQAMMIIKNLFSFDFLASVMLLLLVIFSFGTLVWFFERKNNPEFENNLKGLFSGIWFSTVTMTTVGYGDKAPKSNGGKTVSLIWMLTALIIVSGFTASIAASLTVDHLESNIKSVDDLKKVKVGTVEASSTIDYLKGKGINSENFSSVKDGLQALSDSKVDAFVYDEPLMQFRLANGNYSNKIKILPFTFNKQYYSLAFQKNSPLIDQVNLDIMEIIKSPKWQDILKHYNIEK